MVRRTGRLSMTVLLAAVLGLCAWAGAAQAQCRSGQSQTRSLRRGGPASGLGQQNLLRQQSAILTALQQQSGSLTAAQRQQLIALLQQQSAALSAILDNGTLTPLQEQQLTALLQQQNALLLTLQQQQSNARQRQVRTTSARR